MLLIAVACGSSKSVAKRPVTKKPTTAVARNTRKPAPRPTTQSAERRRIEQQYETAREESKSNSKETVYSKQEILEATTRVKVTTAMVLDYIDTFKDIAKANMAQYGIPASIILGQGILESGAGTGPLSNIANNHFGIKCHKEWTGESVSYDDDSAGECFRKYRESAESYRDHSLFLTSRQRYAGLFSLDKDDYKAWAKGLRTAGYATDPKYPEKLISIIERYQLQRYDAEVLGRDFTPVQREPMESSASRYQVTQGDTLYSISRRFNISVDELRRKNNITDNTISIGQQLIVN